MRRVTTEQLRGIDPLLLDVHLGDIVQRPFRQISVANIADLFAMAEVEDLPRNLLVKVKDLPERFKRGIGDLPNGAEFAEFLDAVGELDASRVPVSLRNALTEEAYKPNRTDADRAKVEAVAEGWTGVEPEPFAVGPRTVNVKKAEAKGSAESISSGRRSAAPLRAKKSAEGETKAKAAEGEAKPKKAGKKPKALEDPERHAFLSEIVIERLAGSRNEKGMMENVLIASVRHRARERYPGLTIKQVMDSLRELGKAGRIQFSARHWKLTGGRGW